MSEPDEPFVYKLLTHKVKEASQARGSNIQQGKNDFFLESINEQVWLSQTGISGDESADTVNGSLDKALLAYPIKHYTYWKEEMQDDAVDVGGYGENLVVLEMDEYSVCVGDTYQFGDAVIQISQPGKPTINQAPHFKNVQVSSGGRTGWYFRVVQEGTIISGIDIKLLDRPYPEWTIAACNEVMYFRKEDLRAADDLASCELLAPLWKQALKKRLCGMPFDLN